MIADAAYEAVAIYLHIHCRGHEQLNAAAEGVDVDFLVLSNHGLAQVKTDAATESIEAGTVECLATINVFVAAIVHRAADALTVLADGQWALQPLVRVSTVAVYNEMYTHIQYYKDAEIYSPSTF